jgi:hypothetical protein
LGKLHSITGNSRDSQLEPEGLEKCIEVNWVGSRMDGDSIVIRADDKYQ